MSIQTTIFAVQRDGTQYGVAGADIGDALVSGDILVLSRDGTFQQFVYTGSVDEILDTDLFACTDEDGVTYQVTGDRFKALFGPPPPPPWEGHDGGIFHVYNKDGIYPTSGSLDLTGGPFTAWDIDGTNERQITEVLKDEELVFVTPKDCSLLFNGNYNEKPIFKEFTDVSKVTNMSSMFQRCQYFSGADLGSWDVSNVTDMSGMFYSTWAFNEDIGGWNVSKVTNMQGMFEGTKAFNQDLNSWDISHAPNVKQMFKGAEDFNGDISGWDVSNVTDMEEMFLRAYDFNQSLNGWNVSNVKNMKWMFSETGSFNGDISGWDTSNVTTMSYMFRSAGVFNIDIGNWNTKNVTNMGQLFYMASAFDQDISGWCVTNISGKPSSQWDFRAGFEGQADKQPQWGTCPRGEDRLP